jgi:ferredoxin
MILYFSGTGNSKYVAEQLSEELGENTLVDIPNAPSSISLRHEQIIWIFPIYSWGVPPIVMRYIQSVEISGAWRHWMVCTCGDDIGFAHKQWRKAITERGWDAGGSFSVVMPNTYTLMKGFDVDPDHIISDKIAAAPGRIHDIATCMQQGREPDDVITGRFASIKSKIIYPWFVKHTMSPKPFHTTDTCIGCGKCAQHCPLHNINISERRPSWGLNCALCLRCYHICPTHAVAYGHSTIGKGQYIFSKKYISFRPEQRDRNDNE